MTTRTSIPRTLSSLTVAALLGLGLTACSSSSPMSTEDFCKVLTETDVSSGSSDPNAAKEQLKKTIDAMNVNPPKEIADDWKTMRDASSSLYDAVKDLDLSTDEGQEKAREASDKLGTDEVEKASDNVNDWQSENCK